MRRVKYHILPLLLALALCLAAFITPTLAFADESAENGKVLEFWDKDAVRPQAGASAETAAPGADASDSAASGNPASGTGEALSTGSEFSTRDLLYDKNTHKQFITVEGRDGNTFYIVIDYDSPINEDEEQYMTYFLNKVDESDLAALVEQGEPAACSCTDKCHAGAVNTNCPLCAVNMSECVGTEPEPEVPEEPAEFDPEPEPVKEASTINPLAVVLAVALLVGGAAYLLKFKKKKPDTKGNTDLDDYDYGDEDDEIEDTGDIPDDEDED